MSRIIRSVYSKQQEEQLKLNLQLQTQDEARTKMNWHEQKLVEKSLEVRKFEKMREKDYESFKEEQDKAEMLILDELSSIMYSKKELR
ncbi:hypothetical protein [Ureibacillus acetophenoni]